MSQRNGNPPGFPGGDLPPQIAMRQQQQVQVPPEEVLHRLVADIEIGANEDGSVTALTFSIPAPHKKYTFLIPTDAAKQIGQKLIAAHVEVPPAGLLIPDRPV